MKSIGRGQCLLGLLLLSVPTMARAETDARDYEALVALPNRAVAAVVYYRHVSSSDTQSYSQDIGVMRAAYVLRFHNLSFVPFDVVLPVADVTVHVAPPALGGLAGALHTSGIGDFEYFPTVGYLIPEGPVNHTYFAFTPYFFFPTGQYDATHPVNIGANRYGFAQEANVGQRFLKIVNVELVGNIAEYTDNTNAQAAQMGAVIKGSFTQKPSGTFTAHVSVDVAPTIYLSVSYYLTVPGEQHFVVNTPPIDVKTVQQQTIHTLRFGAAIRVERATLLLLQYNQDVGTSNGASISRFFGGRVSHVF
jgi:hypothetical protein